MSGIAAADMLPVHDHFSPLADLDGWLHDWRCLGDCGPCGGCGGVEANRCFYCGGSGRCRGCNSYQVHRGREVFGIPEGDRGPVL